MMYYRQAPKQQLTDELTCLLTALRTGVEALMTARTVEIEGIGRELASTAEQVFTLARAATDRGFDIALA